MCSVSSFATSNCAFNKTQSIAVNFTNYRRTVAMCAFVVSSIAIAVFVGNIPTITFLIGGGLGFGLGHFIIKDSTTTKSAQVAGNSVLPSSSESQGIYEKIARSAAFAKKAAKADEREVNKLLQKL